MKHEVIDNRASQRHRVLLAAEIECGGEPRRAHLLNISESGAKLDADEVPNEGEAAASGFQLKAFKFMNRGPGRGLRKASRSPSSQSVTLAAEVRDLARTGAQHAIERHRHGQIRHVQSQVAKPVHTGKSRARIMRRAAALAFIALLSFLAMSTLSSCFRGDERSPGLSPEVSSPRGGDVSSVPRPLPDSHFRTKHLSMVDTQIASRGVKDPGVLDAMRTVPRHQFVPRDQMDQAYGDRALPIGEGQTISQPYIVALMTELLDVQAGEVVLEIGTGSGYQAAVLAELTDRVYTVEILPKLARRAAETLDRLGYARVQTHNADGYFGWAEHGPYDGIIVTAAPDHVPVPLVAQLREGGRMEIPIGPPGSYQTLWRLTKQQGKVVSENITDVAFVPLVRKP